MAVTNLVSTRLLSKRKITGAVAVSFRYEGVVDFVGGRLIGQYVDDKTAAFNNVSCLSTSGVNCTCCGNSGPPYYTCYSCAYNYLYINNGGPSIPSSSFSTNPSGGYYDAATNKGFRTLGYCGYHAGANHTTQINFCASSCGSSATEAYVRGLGGTTLGQNTVAGIKAQDSSLWTWGYNGYGQVGNNNTATTYSPVKVGSSSWKIVRGAYFHFAAIRSDDTLWTWGYNNYGQLGDSTTISRSSPVQVAGSWKFVCVSSYQTFGIRSDDTLWTWGYNGLGSLGDNTTTDKSSPVQVSGGGTWKFVHGDSYNTHAIKTDGTLYGWGYGNYYAIGNGTSTTVYSPVLVAGGFNDWVSVVEYDYKFRYGIRSNGTLWCWGQTPQGVSTATTNRVSPIQVGVSTDHVSGSSQPSFWGPYLSTTRNVPFITSNGNVISYNGYDSTRTTLYGSGSAVEIIIGYNGGNNYYSGVYLIKNVI